MLLYPCHDFIRPQGSIQTVWKSPVLGVEYMATSLHDSTMFILLKISSWEFFYAFIHPTKCYLSLGVYMGNFEKPGARCTITSIFFYVILGFVFCHKKIYKYNQVKVVPWTPVFLLNMLKYYSLPEVCKDYLQKSYAWCTRSSNVTILVTAIWIKLRKPVLNVQYLATRLFYLPLRDLYALLSAVLC